jgi:hypothetical protein
VGGGVVNIVGTGTAKITVTASDGGFTAECSVTVTATSVAVTGISVEPEEMLLTLEASGPAPTGMTLYEDGGNTEFDVYRDDGEKAVEITIVPTPENAVIDDVGWGIQSIEGNIETSIVSAVKQSGYVYLITLEPGGVSGYGRLTATVGNVQASIDFYAIHRD